MEKACASTGAGHPRPHGTAIKPFRRVSTLIGFVLLAIIYFVYSLQTGRTSKPPPTPNTAPFGYFESITPSENLQWNPCYSEYDRSFMCARLTVPMDYSRPLNGSSGNPKVHIALIMLPGRNHTKPQEFSTSPLLLNPGGPGGSGVEFALMSGHHLQRIVGTDQDIIGFDPRGIGLTFPKADCWSTPVSAKDYNDDALRGFFHRFEWNDMGRDIGLINSSNVALQLLDSRNRAVAKLCKKKDELLGDSSILRYASTPDVAQDMLSIIDAWDEWRSSSQPAGPGANLRFKKGEAEKTHDETSQDDVNVGDTKGKLVYWGFSYGTTLGATFASMFPDRVGRVILDGVLDTEQYVSPLLMGSVQDTDKVLEQFFKDCHRAGDKCQLYREGDEVTDLRDKYYSVMNGLRENPITFVDPNRFLPVMVTASILKGFSFESLYFPVISFPDLANVVNLLHERQFDTLGAVLGPSELQSFCSLGRPVSSLPDDAMNVIMCGDKRVPVNQTLAELEESYAQMASSSAFADVWMGVMMRCNTWAIEVANKRRILESGRRKRNTQIETAFPILIISNTHDVVTPLPEALTVAGRFKDAGLIEQHSVGHCTLAAVSLCTVNAIRAYLRNGVVPPAPVMTGDNGREGQWTKCDADEWPWNPFNDDDLDFSSNVRTQNDKDMLQALKGLQSVMRSFPRWGIGTTDRGSKAPNLS